MDANGTPLPKPTLPSRGAALASVGIKAIGAYDTESGLRPARSHADLDRVHDFLNRELFDGSLPPCLITQERAGRAYGHFSGDRVVNIDNSAEVADRIGLNYIHYAAQLTTKVLATFAHEMVHQWQHHYGKPSRGGYHNLEWARKMVEIGLIPSSTGAPGGKPIGECVSHYVKPGGRFEVACAEYLASDTAVLFQDRAYRELAEGDGSLSDGDGSASSAGNRARLERAQRERERKAASKTRFSCPRCKQNAWASRGANLLCGNEDCGEEKMLP